MKKIDIVVPCYNEQEVLHAFYTEAARVLDPISHYSFRFLFVDDGSHDNTIVILKELAAAHDNVKYLSFSRNFGKEAAMYAGLKYSSADYVIVMDADLQHPPAMIPDMLAGIEEGYDCCAAMRVSREGESRIRSFFSQTFYKLSNRMTDIRMPQNAVDFRIMSRNMVNSILSLSEVERFSKGIFTWVGFSTKWIPYENVERTLGTTKWSFWGLFKYAVGGITSFSIAPLRLVSGMGFVIFLFACLYILATLIQTLLFGVDVPGYVTTLCAVLFLGGIVELSVGIIGEYVAHIYMEAKDRPIFILRQTNLSTQEEESAHGNDTDPVC
ncbi:MAG: glycosyltransferase family 2 protein [Lachnospiraceae bacterium]|jgi:glucosyltransferase|nr:glycosyltransferase family 2 protein [Lachnospiraceae bacterium]